MPRTTRPEARPRRPAAQTREHILAVAGELFYRDDNRATLPCHVYDPDLWFAASPADLDRAKALCISCPVRCECLAGALQRREPWGVWGGEIVENGRVLPLKRARGRPRLSDRTTAHVAGMTGRYAAESANGAGE